MERTCRKVSRATKRGASRYADDDVVDVRARVATRNERMGDQQRAVRLVRRERLRRIATGAHDIRPRRGVDDGTGRLGCAVAAVGSGGEQRDARRVFTGFVQHTRGSEGEFLAASAARWSTAFIAGDRDRRLATPD